MRRALIPIAVLVVLGAPAWPTTIDDSYITLGFAHSLATRGLFTCGGGTAYGFSSPSSVALASRAWPRGPQSAVLLLAVATWEPLAYWSFAGLETTWYAFLLAAGWLLVLRDVEAGLGVLALAAFTRPEGPLHFVAGGLVLLIRGRGAAPRFVLYAGLLGAYYGVLFLEFGTILPTATWVKIALSHSLAASVGQHVGDLLSGVGLFAGCALLFRAPRLPVLLPLVLQLAVACAAAADWMAHALEEDFPLRQESRVIRSNEAPALLLALWTEPEDTMVRFRWSCADAWSEVSVPGEVRVRLPPLDCAPRSSIVVEVAGEPQPPELRAALLSAPP